MLMITYCFFLRDMLEPQVPQERLENEEQEYVPPLLSAFCFIFFFFISNIILKNALFSSHCWVEYCKKSQRTAEGKTDPLAWSFSVTFKENSREESSYLCTTKIFVKRVSPPLNNLSDFFFQGCPRNLWHTRRWWRLRISCECLFLFTYFQWKGGGGGKERKVKSFVGLKPDLRLKELFSTVVF